MLQELLARARARRLGEWPSSKWPWSLELALRPGVVTPPPGRGRGSGAGAAPLVLLALALAAELVGELVESGRLTRPAQGRIADPT